MRMENFSRGKVTELIKFTEALRTMLYKEILKWKEKEIFQIFFVFNK